MRTVHRILFVVSIVQLFSPPDPGRACGPDSYLDPRIHEYPLSEDASFAAQAMATIRAVGPAGMEAFLKVHAELLKLGPEQADPTAWQRFTAALDTIAGQRDAYAARLYWFTDLDKAKTAASETRKPILSLRLLGKLTDEYSCANSRFFRTALYANKEVSKLLRERFVLHWESVRPVPVVTIDMGDGRTLKRTLTGNSIHYVLDGYGRPIDALPGLYGPKAFMAGLDRAAGAVRYRRSFVRNDYDKAATLACYHAKRFDELAHEWRTDLERLGIQPRDIEDVAGAETPCHDMNGGHAFYAPNAQVACNVTVTKAGVETALINGILIVPISKSLESATTDSAWPRIAALHTEDARLDAGSRAIIRSQHPPAAVAAPVAVAKAVLEDPLVRVVQSFEQSMALDTVRNEYLLHRRIHEWFAKGTAGSDVKALNERVYTELFLTPSSDPWLGLVPADTYSALADDGMACK